MIDHIIKDLEVIEVAEGHCDIYPTKRTPRTLPIAVLDHKRDGLEEFRKSITPLARKMAAAPDLYEALKEICDMQEANYGNATNTHIRLSNLMEKARKALSAAQGGES